MSKYFSKYKIEITFNCLLLAVFISYGAVALQRFSTSNEAFMACKEWRVKIINLDIGCIDSEEKFRVKKSFPYGGIFDKRPSPPLNYVVQ